MKAILIALGMTGVLFMCGYFFLSQGMIMAVTKKYPRKKKIILLAMKKASMATTITINNRRDKMGCDNSDSKKESNVNFSIKITGTKNKCPIGERVGS